MAVVSEGDIEMEQKTNNKRQHKEDDEREQLCSPKAVCLSDPSNEHLLYRDLVQGGLSAATKYANGKHILTRDHMQMVNDLSRFLSGCLLEDNAAHIDAVLLAYNYALT